MAPVRVAVLLAFVLTAPVLAGCLADTPDDADVLATFYPLYYLTSATADGAVTVGTIVPPGQEPHDWEPSFADISRIDAAHLVIAQRTDFEPWLRPLVGNLGNDAPRVAYTAAELHAEDLPEDDEAHDDEDNETDAHDGDEHRGHDEDPHTWLDPVLFNAQAEIVMAELVDQFPEHADILRANNADLMQEITSVHGAYTARLADCRLATLVTQHAAFEILAHRYGLTAESVEGIHPEAEPSAQDIDRIIQIVRDNDIPIIFTEPGADRRIMQNIAAETGATVHTLDPVETPGDGDWKDRMLRNLDLLSEALECP